MASGGGKRVQGRPVPTPASRPSSSRGPGLGGKDQLSALTAVAATLTQQIAAQTGALSANTAALVNAARGLPGRGPNRPGQAPAGAEMAGKGLADKIGGVLSGSLMGIVTKLVAPLAPLAAFAQILQTTTSGFGTFLKMTGLISTALAGLMLPAMLVLSGVTYAVAREMQGPLLGAMRKMVPMMEGLMATASGLHDTWESLTSAFDAFGIELDLTTGSIGWLNEQVKATGGSLRELIGVISGKGAMEGLGKLFGGKGGPAGGGQDILEGLLSKQRKAPEENLPGLATGSKELEKALKGKRGESFEANMMRGMRMAMQSMRQDIGPPAQFGQDLTNIWRQATLAGLNVDPIQKAQLDLMLKQLEAMDGILAEMKMDEGQYK